MDKYTYTFDDKVHESSDDEDQRDLIDAETRKSLPTDRFALPEERKYPIDTAARVRNAAARLEQQKDSMSSEKYSKARARIAAAAKRFGIDSEYNKKEMGESADMSECSLQGDSIELKDPGEEKEIWIQVAKQGKFRGHRAGPFEMNAQTFAEIIRNFESQENRLIPCDFEHASEAPATEGSIPDRGAPAQGWITRLEMRADGNLWGLVEWLPLAKKYIKNKQYRYLSPAIVFGARDRVTGKPIGAKLSSVALTNSPYLDGMQPLAAKDIQKKEIDSSVVEVIRIALQLPEYMKDEFLLNTLKAFAASTSLTKRHCAKVLREGLCLPLTMTDEEVFKTARIACGEIQISEPAEPASAEDKTPVTAKESNMDEAKKEKELQNQVDQLTLKLTGAEAEVKTLKASHQTELDRLTLENAELKKKVDEQTERELTELVDVTLATWGEKKGLTEQHRPILLRQAKSNREDFLTMYPPIPPAKRHLSQNLTGGKKTPEHVPSTVPAENATVRMADIIENAEIPPIEEYVQKIRKEDPSLQYEAAFSKAHTMRTKDITKATQKHMNSMGGV